MRSHLPILLITVCLLVLTSCDTASVAPASAQGAEQAQRPDLAARNFVAPLSGAEEVPAVDTQARGNATFRLSSDGTELHFRLIVANLVDVTMAHIHLGAAGVNGPAIVWLYPDAPPPQQIDGRFSGVLAEGVITSDDLAGPLADDTLGDLLDLMRAGDTYVNVHTDEFPAGEIRGQIRPAGPGER